MSLLFHVVLSLTCCASWCFNIDLDFPTVVRGDSDSYFGFTVALHRNAAGKSLALVGAIRANSSLEEWKDIYEPGVLYQCPLQEEAGHCTEVVVERTGHQQVTNTSWQFRYRDHKDNMTLGMSLDVSPEGKIVVCGPLWKNRMWHPAHTPNGVCYVMKSDFLEPKKLLPLINGDLQIDQDGDYYYYLAQCGFSAGFTAGGDLVLGTPGFDDWRGSVLRYEPSLKTFSPPVPFGSSKGLYIGYSVASGRFFNDEDLSIAAGAPRGNDLQGEVYLLSSTGSAVKAKLLGNQIGEYFGASLLAIDLDNHMDRFDDLLVGAPQFTEPNGMDEGRVYIYRSGGNGLYPSGTLDGNSAPGSRFGTSIANIGDINMDGFDDIAVGAPYEDDVGAVYIYHGDSTLGSRSVYTQRILASAVSARTGVPMKGFGISISRGFDVDSNHYKDVIVGAYLSDSAVLFRTRPVIRANGSIEADITMINADMSSCEISDGRTFSCFTLKLCLSYDGAFVSNELEFDTELTIDTRRTTEERLARGFVYHGPDQVNQSRTVLNARAGFSTCISRKVYLHTTFVDPVIPFEVRFAYDLKKPAEGRWCSSCPVLDTSFPETVSKIIPYQHGCRREDVCKCDLKLDVDVGGYNPDIPFIVGEQVTLLVDVKVQNRRSGDPAYLARAVLQIPSTVTVVNKDTCSILDDHSGIVTIVCDAGNPLKQGIDATFQLKLDLGHVLESFTLNASATTTSEELQPKDNHFSRALPFIYQADVSIFGRARPDIVEFNAETNKVLMEHSFLVTKKFPSPVRAVKLTVRVPYVFSESGPAFSSIRKIKVFEGDLFVPGTCRFVEGYFTWKEDTAANSTTVRSPSRNRTRLSGRVQRSVGSEEATEQGALHGEEHIQINFDNVPPLNCLTSLCHEVRCTLGPFLSRTTVAHVTFYVLFDMKEFTRQAGMWYAFSVGSEGSVRILDNITFTGTDEEHKEIRVATVLQKEGPLPAEKIAPWIIAVSAFSGLVVFSLLLAALIHLGFFRRRRREALEKLLAENQENEWQEFIVSDDEVLAEKELFRRSMAVGNMYGETDITEAFVRQYHRSLPNDHDL